jgi:uncharacterized repeat protein (TIGR03833 family)
MKRFPINLNHPKEEVQYVSHRKDFRTSSLAQRKSLQGLLQRNIIIKMDGTIRKNISSGLHVKIVLKQDQMTGKLTDGYVKDILTKSPQHPHGVKVRLETGEVGRIKVILTD